MSVAFSILLYYNEAKVHATQDRILDS